MKPITPTALCFPLLTLAALAIFADRSAAQQFSDGFVPLFNGRDLSGWSERKFAPKGAQALYEAATGNWAVRNGEIVCVGEAHVFLRSDGQYGDYVLQLEFKLCRNCDSGLYIRCNEKGNVAHQTGMKILIFDPAYVGKMQGEHRIGIGGIGNVIAAGPAPVRPIGQWNSTEIRCEGDDIEVLINGTRTVLADMSLEEKLRNRPRSGYICLANINGEAKGMAFRNIRIKDLSAPNPQSPSPTTTNDSLLDILSQQAPNATAWATAPLDVSIPGEIRQSLTLLREDLLDEGKANPKSGAEAYAAAQKLCDALIVSLDERDRTLVRAGFRAAQADANTRVTNQSLDAHAPYRSSWPQYARIKDQRAEIFRQQMNYATVRKELPKVEWSDRTAVLRNGLDALYAKYRDALRQGR